MLRAVSGICVDSQALLLFSTAKRDIYRLFRTSTLVSAASPNQHPRKIRNYRTTVITSEAQKSNGSKPSPAASHPHSRTLPPPGSPPPTPPHRAWAVAAATLAITASLGGVYFYKKISDDKKLPQDGQKTEESALVPERRPIPPKGENIPKHIQYLLVGAGTASFAAMRAIRSQKPEAQVVMVGSEYQLPYMRPPLSKELWREPNLHSVEDLDALTFKQWNGRTRSVSYEPSVFYTPVENLSENGGTAVLRGWTVTKIDVENHEAELTAPGCEPVTVTYDKCLIATGSRPRRIPALRAAARAGRALCLRTVQDAQRLASALEVPGTNRVLVLGAGFLATELSAALADRLKESNKSVMQMYREKTPLETVMPDYLADEAARNLKALGVSLIPNSEISEAKVVDDRVQMRLSNGETMEVDLVVECVGSELDTNLPSISKLEVHPELGGILVNAELQARTDVYAAGDAACYYDVVLGRRRVEHHDHAVASGRRAGENMITTPQHYNHQSMFWSDLGPRLGYEAIGIIDSQLQTLGVFCEDAVHDLKSTQIEEIKVKAINSTNSVETDRKEERIQTSDVGKEEKKEERQVSEETLKSGDARALSYDRGVVFYMREKRVVGVLLWNLFNRMHIARQVLAQGEFEDLFEVAKLFSLHEED